MVGQAIDVYGRGIHDYAQASPNGPVMVQRDGRYQSGTFTVSTVDDLLFWFNSNADGQSSPAATVAARAS